MKILFVISSLGIGGEQRAASILTNEFIERGHDVELMTFQRNKKEIEFHNKVKIETVKGLGFTSLFKRIKLIRAKMKSNSYDIYVGFAVIPSILVSLANIGLNKNVITCERNDPRIYPLYWKVIRNFAYSFSKGAVFQTSDAMDYFGNKFEQQLVIPNPLDANTLPQLHQGEKSKRIVNTSRFTKAKNHLILINAFSKIHHKYPEFKLEFYGEGPLKKNMQDRVLELNLTEKVLFHNPTTTVLKEIKNASIFVLPSNNEGYPNALVEALALGIPSISSDCRIGGPKDMINHGENGFLFEVGNENDLKLALDNLLSNKKVQQAFSTNSVDIVKKLNAESISMKWISFFEEVKSRNEEK